MTTPPIDNKITCIGCGRENVPNWDGERRCIKCARDKVLGLEDNQRSELHPLSMINGLDCVACGQPTLILGDGGYVTCSFIDCPTPDFSEALDAYVAAQVLKARRDEIGCVQSTAGRFNVVTYIHSDTGMTVSDRFLELERLTAKEKP